MTTDTSVRNRPLKLPMMGTTGCDRTHRSAVNRPPVGTLLANTQQLVRLETQSPTRVLLTVFDGRTHVVDECRTVHRLQEEVLECQMLVLIRLRALLWIDKLQLISVYEDQLRSEERSVGKECRSRWSPYH